MLSTKKKLTWPLAMAKKVIESGTQERINTAKKCRPWTIASWTKVPTLLPYRNDMASYYLTTKALLRLQIRLCGFI